MNRTEAIQELLKQGELPTQDRIDLLLTKTNPETVKIIRTKTDDSETNVKITKQYNYTPKKINTHDFSKYFRKRYNLIKNLLVNRPGLSNATSISRALADKTKDKRTIICIVSDITKLPTGTLKIVLEDTSGKIDAIISSKKPDLLEDAKYIALDEVLAFTGGIAKETFFVDEIVWPDTPAKPINYSTDETYAVFSGDVHFGSNMFLPKEFDRFVMWLRGEFGSEKQKKVANKTKYVFFPGDLVDGVGVYPGQDKELTTTDIYKQYDLFAEAISRIPSDKQIIIIPGNHDAVRLEEPQPIIDKTYAAPLHELPNVHLASNPCYLNIHGVNGSPGFDVLLYHGYSFDFFVDKIEGLRQLGGYDAADELQKFLLKRRHLAPTYGSTLTLPYEEDPTFITRVPDILVTGHIHKAKIGRYKNTHLISASCWQAMTSFQEKVGHNPDPAMVPMLNLKEQKTTMLTFK